MKVLILGGQGNLGSQLVASGQQLNHEISSWDQLEVDLTDWSATEAKLANQQPHILINAVAYNAVDACESQPGHDLAYILNRDLVSHLAHWCREKKVTMIHYSSDYVFAGNQVSGYTETDQPDPINEYGRSKLAGEQALIKQGEAGLNYYLIRTSKLFGPRGTGLSTKLSFFDIMLKLARTETELKGVDAEISCFTYTPDLARATWQLLNDQLAGGIYHIVNGQPATWYQSLETLHKLAGLTIPIRPISSTDLSRSAQRPQHSVLLMTKLPSLRSYVEALNEYLNNSKLIN
jgi:dTDP-4-dehydrorhamnose reductase